MIVLPVRVEKFDLKLLASLQNFLLGIRTNFNLTDNNSLHHDILHMWNANKIYASSSSFLDEFTLGTSVPVRLFFYCTSVDITNGYSTIMFT